MGDGAAVCVLTTRANAEKEGMEILGKYVTSAVVSVEPKVMGISPVVAVPKVLEMAGLTKEDIDVYEVCLCTLRSRALNHPMLLCRSTKHSHRNSPTVWKSLGFLSKRSTPMVVLLPSAILSE